MHLEFNPRLFFFVKSTTFSGNLEIFYIIMRNIIYLYYFGCMINKFFSYDSI